MRRLLTLADVALIRFTNWFCSRGGVWQTSLVTLAIVVTELADRRLDPHGFWLLYLLTVYSAITQPALAYAGSVNAARMEALEAQNTALLERIDQLLEGQQALHAAVSS